MIALPVVLLALFEAGNPVAVLHTTAAVYGKLRSFEIKASLSFKVPARDVIVTTGQAAYYADSSMLPPDSPVPVLQLRMSGGATTYRNSAGRTVKVEIGFGFNVPSFPFNYLDVVDTQIHSARALPDESLLLGGSSIPCTIIEAVYDKHSVFGQGRPVRFWIEKKTGLVRQAKYEAELRTGGGVVEVTARVDSMTVDQPPPKAALDGMARMTWAHQETKWAGQAAPDFAMKSLDGQTVTLTELRGRVVVLDFWATWCGPCREEMQVLEKLRDDLKSKGVQIWGVTNEKPVDARRWLAEYKRKLPTLIDADNLLFRHYAIESIPALIVLRPDAKVSSFIVGLSSERDLREQIAKAAQQ